MFHLRIRLFFALVLGLGSLFLAAGCVLPAATSLPLPVTAAATATVSPLTRPRTSTVEPSTPLSCPTLTATRLPVATPTPTPSSPPVPTRTPVTSPTPTLTPTPTSGPLVYGQSAGGRELVAWQFGHGPTALVVVGGTHGGLEWNTTELIEALRDHLLADPGLLPGGVRLLLVPLANPDGAAAGVGLAGRVNAHGVDLDRNWGTGWARTTQWGAAPFSEPETVALRDLLAAEGVRAAVFYHSFDAVCLHGGIFAGPGPASASLAVAMAEATGYPVSPAGVDCCPAGGRAVEWLAAQGLAAMDVHLPDRFQLDWEANVAGLKASLQWTVTPEIATLTPTPEGTPVPHWTAPSPLYGDVATGYPLAAEAGRFTLHYQPGTPAEGDTDYLVGATERALAHVNETLGVDSTWHFDLYVAGTPFAYPGETSRGYTLAYGRQVFVRYDGTGPLVEFDVVLAHELTHLTALNEFRPASSVMLSEGLAVYVQWPVLEAAGWLKLDQVCMAMQSAGALPSVLYLVSDEAGYDGYVDQDNYVASACFVVFLARRWGMGKVARLYHSADWEGVTGLSLAELDRLWAEATAARADEVAVDTAALVELLDEMGCAYAYLAAHLGKVRGQPAGWALDGLRVTWRMGRFDKARAYADEFRALTAGP